METTKTPIRRARTAIGRGGGFSRPVRLAVEAGLVAESRTFFDFGCGRGEDIHLLRDFGVDADGWDPSHRPSTSLRASDVVNIGYVVNVIEDPNERACALRSAWDLAGRILIVAARLLFDGKLPRSDPYSDGCLTSRTTFQKFYSQTELREWVDTTLGVTSVPAAPGVLFVFRDELDRLGYLAARYRHRRTAPRIRQSERRFEEHKDLLAPLIAFVTDRARLPRVTELEQTPQIVEEFGSIKRAFALIRRVTGSEQWDQIRQERTSELLIQIALNRFDGRPRMSDLPLDLQYDMREFFSSYKAACARADELLFSVGDMECIERHIAVSQIGKRTGNALYVHADWIHTLPLELRVYEGCARAYLGSMEEADVIKLHRDSPRVSYLTYNDFDRNPHPALLDSYLVKLGGLSISYRNYEKYTNPPILHRKEEMLGEDDPRRERFCRLTKQEERWGLYEDPQRIGSQRGWDAVLAENGAEFRGTRLVRLRANGAD
jgi:DNA phosphorothioation-associated putative methyltransferase